MQSLAPWGGHCSTNIWVILPSLLQYTVTIAWFSDAISWKLPFHQVLLELLVRTGNCSQMSHCISALYPWREGIGTGIQVFCAILESQTTGWLFPIQQQIYFVWRCCCALIILSIWTEPLHCHFYSTASWIDSVMRELGAVSEMTGQAQSVWWVVRVEPQRGPMLANDGKIVDTWHVEIQLDNVMCALIRIKTISNPGIFIKVLNG